jgi:hypothetical protein
MGRDAPVASINANAGKASGRMRTVGSHYAPIALMATKVRYFRKFRRRRKSFERRL